MTLSFLQTVVDVSASLSMTSSSREIDVLFSSQFVLSDLTETVTWTSLSCQTRSGRLSGQACIFLPH